VIYISSQAQRNPTYLETLETRSIRLIRCSLKSRPNYLRFSRAAVFPRDTDGAHHYRRGSAQTDMHPQLLKLNRSYVYTSNQGNLTNGNVVCVLYLF